MRFFSLILLVSFSLLSYGQEDWILYQKHKESSITNNKKVSILNDSAPYNTTKSETKDSSVLNYITKNGFLTFKKDVRIDSLNNFLKKYGSYNLYSVQISFSQETDEIKKTRKKFIQSFPNEILYDEYTAPNIFLYAGKFYSRNDALILKRQLENSFDNTMVVKKSFSLIKSPNE